LEIVIAYLPSLACAAAMVVCFRMMGRHQPAATEDAAQRELTELRRRLTLLEADRGAETEESLHG
jgi:hypothetical protein